MARAAAKKAAAKVPGSPGTPDFVLETDAEISSRKNETTPDCHRKGMA